MLHVPCYKEALLRHGSEPDSVRAGRRPEREGNGEGSDEASRWLVGCSCCFHRRQARRAPWIESWHLILMAHSSLFSRKLVLSGFNGCLLASYVFQRKRTSHIVAN
ncbi:hypothetical protein OIU84_025009 [Salix udensis]|uniref:Uncharacterized protein n=1 Tax=Salix udensis TaxID=889485 RepID=A0AAD6KIK2_9ROSI|nr:hypothetical protein OIU84_025009 [Salix udensis]